MRGLFIIESMVAAMSGYNTPRPSNLTEAENNCLDYVEECLYGSNELINDKSTELMLLLLKYCAAYEDKPMTDEEFETEKNKILEGLSEDDVDTLEIFLYCYYQKMSIYSRERDKNKTLKMKGNDYNDKN